MTTKRRGKRWTVEVYDPSKASRKRYVGRFDTQQEARGGQARGAADRRAEGTDADTTVADFAGRWLDLHPRQEESTNIGYAAQVKPFVASHGALSLHEVTVELSLEWALERRWTLGGVRATFSDARRRGLVETNPFTNLRLQGSRGRKDIEVLARVEVDQVVLCAHDVWSGEVACTMPRSSRWPRSSACGRGSCTASAGRTSICAMTRSTCAASTPRRAAARATQDKNGKPRDIALTGPAKAALAEMPRPLDADELIFRTSRGGPITGRVQHYYCARSAAASASRRVDLYELRHFCASWLFNDMALPAQDVAHQLGHTDGGALVQRLYGHASERLARERIKRGDRRQAHAGGRASRGNRRQD